MKPDPQLHFSLHLTHLSSDPAPHRYNILFTSSDSLLPIHFPQYPLLPFFLGSPKPISTLSWILEYACSSRISYIWAKNTQRNLADTKSSQDSSNGHSETHQCKRPQRWSLRSRRANMWPKVCEKRNDQKHRTNLRIGGTLFPPAIQTPQTQLQHLGRPADIRTGLTGRAIST